MDINEDKHLEKIIRKAMDSSRLESPSKDFTSSIMGEIHAMEAQTKIASKPLISKTTFFIVGLIISLIFVVLNTFNTKNESTLIGNTIDKLNFDFNLNFLSVFNQFNVSEITLYAVLLFGLMFIMQIPILKHYYYSKRSF